MGYTDCRDDFLWWEKVFSKFSLVKMLFWMRFPDEFCFIAGPITKVAPNDISRRIVNGLPISGMKGLEKSDEYVLLELIYSYCLNNISEIFLPANSAALCRNYSFLNHSEIFVSRTSAVFPLIIVCLIIVKYLFLIYLLYYGVITVWIIFLNIYCWYFLLYYIVVTFYLIVLK